MIEYTVQVYENKTEWLLDGKRHRINGSAIEWMDGSKEWILQNQELKND